MFTEQQHGPLRPTLTHFSPPVHWYLAPVEPGRAGATTRSVRPGLLAFLAAFALPLAACGGWGGGPSGDARVWDGPPRADATGRLGVEPFEAYLDAHSEDA